MAAAVVAAAAGVSVISSVAAGSSNASSFVPMAPCRLFDTRPAPDNIGPRAIPLGAGDVFTVDTWGTNGNCTIPSGATALSLNVVAIGPTASSYLTVYPGGTARPTASSLNWTAGQAPTPNAVTAALNGTGQLSFYNLAGSVNIAADVVGYYEPSTSGPAGATGPVGPAGPQGAPGVDPANIIWVASSGGDFTTISAALATITDNDSTHRYVIKLAPGTYTENNGIDMKDYVDIEGSGPSSVISSTGSGTDRATVRVTGALHTELRNLTVASTGGVGVIVKNTTSGGDVSLSSLDVTATGTNPVRAVYLDGGRAELSDVAATATSNTFQKIGIDLANSSVATVEGSRGSAVSTTNIADCYGIRTESSTLTLLNTAADVSGCQSTSHAVHSGNSTLTMDQVRATATGVSGGAIDVVYNFGSTVTIDRLTALSVGSGFSGSGIFSTTSTVLVRDSWVKGPSNSIYRSSGGVIAVDTVFDGSSFGMSGNCTNAMTTALAAYTCA